MNKKGIFMNLEIVVACKMTVGFLLWGIYCGNYFKDKKQCEDGALAVNCKSPKFAFSRRGHLKKCRERFCCILDWHKRIVTSEFLSILFLYLFFLFHFSGLFLLDTRKPLISIILFIHAGLFGLLSMILSCYKKVDGPPNNYQNSYENEQDTDVSEGC